MAKIEQPKFKYILSPENTYVVDFGNLVHEISGADIMKLIREFIDQSGN
jgi:hypothetical protein